MGHWVRAAGRDGDTFPTVGELFSTAVLVSATGVLLIVAGIASPLSDRFGIPVLVLFLALGMLAGSEGIGRIPFDNYDLAFRLGTVALVLILFDGGLNTAPSVFRQAVTCASLLATVSVVLTALVVALAGLALGLSRPLALLIGAVVSSTDAAAVFSILRGSGIQLRRSARATLEVESGLNDPMAFFLTMATTDLIVGGDAPLALVGSFFQQLVVGGAGGVAVGYAGRYLLHTVALPAAGLYPALTVAFAFLGFGVPSLLGGSGFLGVYLTAIVLAGGAIPYRAGVRRVHDALAWLAQILMFVLLGLLVYPSRLVSEIGVGVVLALVLAFAARPLGVLPVLAAFRMPWQERLFVSWVGLRGAVPIILAAYPVLRGVPEGDQIFHLVFFVVLVNSLIPGATLPWIAGWLGLGRGAPPRPAASVELVSLREFGGQFSWFFVSPASAVAGAYLRDLPLPDGCVVTLIVRDKLVIAPRGATQLQPGDQVCVFLVPDCGPLLVLLFGGEPEDGPV
jgi:potassium/hydrogen antiporter